MLETELKLHPIQLTASVSADAVDEMVVEPVNEIKKMYPAMQHPCVIYEILSGLRQL